MKYLLSIAWRTFEVLGVEDVFLALESNDLSNIGGIELATGEIEVMEKVIDFCNKKDMEFQCHTPNFKDLELIFPYLEDVGAIGKKYGKNINVVLHSNEDDDLEKSIEDTKVFVKRIMDFIREKSLDVTISLENLNYHHGHQRINVSLIDNILKEFEDLKFTYDIGHDIFDNKENSKLSDLQKQKINNVHLHNVHNGKDHVTMFKTPENVQYLKNAVWSLEEMNYEGNIVVEVGVNFYDGETHLEMISNYIRSIKEIKEEFSKK